VIKATFLVGAILAIVLFVPRPDPEPAPLLTPEEMEQLEQLERDADKMHGEMKIMRDNLEDLKIQLLIQAGKVWKA
jgi:hypothetical protein